jgi:hypothetical protein
MAQKHVDPADPEHCKRLFHTVSNPHFRYVPCSVLKSSPVDNPGLEIALVSVDDELFARVKYLHERQMALVFLRHGHVHILLGYIEKKALDINKINR